MRLMSEAVNFINTLLPISLMIISYQAGKTSDVDSKAGLVIGGIILSISLLTFNWT